MVYRNWFTRSCFSLWFRHLYMVCLMCVGFRSSWSLFALVFYFLDRGHFLCDFYPSATRVCGKAPEST
jgi:hypothetical protein